MRESLLETILLSIAVLICFGVATSALEQPDKTIANNSESAVADCVFKGDDGPIPDHIWQKMLGKSWHPDMGCPARDELRYLQLSYHDFAMRPKIGELIVARSSTQNILKAFSEIFCSKKFAIAKMKLVSHYEGNDDRSMRDNNTSAFNCRRVAGRSRMSDHSYGAAIDINPVQNPYVRRGTVAPRAGYRFVSPRERRGNHVGLIKKGDIVTKAFARIGWKWGGEWRYSKDYQHFSRSGH